MAEIVNLRRARKAKAKHEKDKIAEANRIAFGRTKSEKELSAARMTHDAKRLDGHKISEPSDET